MVLIFILIFIYNVNKDCIELIQFIKFEILVDSITIGIKLWFNPQISEHCPKKIPGRYINNIDWFNRPGVESILIPIEGIVQAWITSIDVVIIRIG